MRAILNGVVLAVLLLPSVARGQDPGVDEVTLKNGGTVRGTVISAEPGTSVRILEADQHEPRTIPWSEVADIERGKYGHAPGPPVQPGSAGAGYGGEPSQSGAGAVAPGPPGGDGVVHVQIRSPSPASLVVDGFVGGSVLGPSGAVCESPCNRTVDGSGGKQFRISGDFPDSGLVSFAGMRGDVLVAVKPGSTGMRTLGWVTLVSGITGAAAGATLLLMGLAAALDRSTIPNPALWIGGGVASGVGVAFIAGGLLLLGVSLTKVDVRPGASSANHPAARKPNYLLGEF